MEHTFTSSIKFILEKEFQETANEIFEKSLLLQYINEKTRSANRGSKSRSSFANLYAIYVIIEDYISNGFQEKDDYSDYEGALFNNLFARQRELPFGNKLQNHALNNRMNAEFQKYFPNAEYIPIIRNLTTNRYWINENLLKIQIGHNQFNISKAIIEIIDEYSKTKQDAFQRFIKSCEELQKIESQNSTIVEDFIIGLLAPNVDARLFEIVSFSILKYHYQEQSIYWGYDLAHLNKENLKLFKTGRTNANDGGIDFVMKPLGRFFQVTETLDFKKYFLDIDKIQKFPVTFVIKADVDIDILLSKIRQNAIKTYSINSIVDNYLSCIEELINIPILQQKFKEAVKNGYINQILEEILNQSKVEFNYSEHEEIDEI